jgi:gliding motility-associated-like protein
MVVTVIDECNGEEVIFWVPNTFTPDGDQFNQTFKPVMYSGFDPFEYEFLIFNRWGEPIWESHNAAVGWDGSYNKGMKCPDGIYTWKLVFKTLNNDEKLMNVGHVTLIR